jgi:hypothetical protein
MNLAPGARLGAYEIVAPLGAGDVSSDGQRFLVVTREEDLQDELVTVVVNWAAALKN